MSVAEVIAQALLDAGVKVITYVPGYGGSDIFRVLESKVNDTLFISFHEEPAYTIALGAALTGKRSVSLFKTHGIMKAGNAVSDSLFAGTTAGFVTIITEDQGGTHSDSIIEARPFLEGIGMPYLVSTPGRIYEDIFRAYAMSEHDRLPYALVINADDVKGVVSPANPPGGCPADWPEPPSYSRNVQQHVMAPLFNPYQRKVYEAKRNNLNWKSIPIPPLPPIPESTPPNWKKIVEIYVPLFRIFKKYRGDIVTGDTGVSSQFSSEPWNCIDIVTYMGGSIPLAIGAKLAGFRDVWAITGDFSFISAGPLGLLEAYLRKIPLKILILYNGRASTTGGQTIPAGALEKVLSGYKEMTRWVNDPNDTGDLEKVLKEMADNPAMQIVILDYRKLF